MLVLLTTGLGAGRFRSLRSIGKKVAFGLKADLLLKAAEVRVGSKADIAFADIAFADIAFADSNVCLSVVF